LTSPSLRFARLSEAEGEFLPLGGFGTIGAEDFPASFQKRLDQEAEALIEVARASGGRTSDRAIQDT